MSITYSLTQNQLFSFLEHIINSSELSANYNANKNTIKILKISDQFLANIKLPWILPPFPSIDGLLQFINENNIKTLAYVIVLIQAGYSAVCRCSNSQILEHKLIRKYMVRKKQGKAQITFLHTKGKSRAGSRIRLAQTVEFFEEINQRVNSWIHNNKPDRLLISCPPRLWGLLFQSKIQPEFTKKDNRIFRIPLDIKIPDKEELLRVNEKAQKCIIESEDKSIIDLLASIQN